MLDRPSFIILDDLLLDAGTFIEPSDRDLRIIENRYRLLKQHLERSGSVLAPYLVDGQSFIYPQGSCASSTLIVSGTDGDRFDVDAIVQFRVPAHWSDKQVLDELHKALKGFPDARGIERCTRCVQVKFAFMHLDVTILDPVHTVSDNREGDIFHSPNEDEAYRVKANPHGFARWYRMSVADGVAAVEFSDRYAARRAANHINRLQDVGVALSAEQDDLPPAIPARLDAQQALALKLLKRFLNVRYEEREERRPPSVYVTKLSSTCGFEPMGLTAQLLRLASTVEDQMEKALAACAGPDERNPVCKLDRLNDRWPTTQADRRALLVEMRHLRNELHRGAAASFAEMATILEGLFGEKIARNAAKAAADRRDNRDGSKPTGYQKQTGLIAAPGLAIPKTEARPIRTVPDHHFHCSIKKSND